MHHLRSRLHNLRTQYMRERRKVVHSIKMVGNSMKPTYKPTLWCYEKLSFLRKHRKKKAGIAPIEKDDALSIPDEADHECDDVITLTYEGDHHTSMSNANTPAQPANLRIIPCTGCSIKTTELLNKSDNPSKLPIRSSCSIVPLANVSNKAVASSVKGSYATAKTINPKINNFTSLYPANSHIVNCDSVSESNDAAITDKSYEPSSSEPKSNLDTLEDELNEELSKIRGVLASRVSNKRKQNKYDWLGKQVVFEISKISSEVLQEETAWAIQTLLRRNVTKDRTLQQKGINRGQSQNHTSSTPKNTQALRTMTIDSNDPLEEDPLAEDMQDILEEDFS